MSAATQEALSRVVQGESMSNYPAIYHGFAAKGIPEADIRPRVNVFTFNAWRELGRVVRRGEHGVRVVSFVPMTRRDEATGALVQLGRRPRSVTVFHVTQTEPMSHAAATLEAGPL